MKIVRVYAVFLTAFILYGTFILKPRLSYGGDYGFQPMNTIIHTKEDFFRLYTMNLYADIDSVSRNIFFLELAYTMPWDDTPLVFITNETQYEKYQFLLMTHICVLLTQEYINFGYLFMKENIYFFNEEFLTDYLDGYEVAEFYFTHAGNWWKEAIQYAQSADSYTGVKMDKNFWGHNFDFENEVYQMKTGELDYLEVINDLFERITENRETISNMMEAWG